MLLKIPATSANLGPGFDCIGMALNLYNYLEFEVVDQENYLSIDIDGEGKGSLAKDKSNLVYQAFSKVFTKNGLPIPGIKFKLTNNIPLARGLGSSSAAIIGGLMAANYFLSEKLSTKELLDLALEFEGHPDNIAPALLGGIVLCTVNSEKTIFYHKMSPPDALYCTILIPQYELSTKRAREVLPEQVPLKDAIFNVGKMGLFINAINTGNLELLQNAMEDKLHQPYRSKLIPGLSDLLAQANNSNVLGIAISGAGPSIIIFHKKEDADEVILLQQQLAKNGTNSKLINLKPVIEGAQVM
ncbi:MAG: homoserine kinase [Peptococcales bacterium]|jgi:homoserine kinase